MRASYYAKALYDLGTSSSLTPDALLSNFLSVVSLNGHQHMLPRIVRFYEKSLKKREKEEIIGVTTAVESSQTDITALLRKEPFSKILSSSHKRVVRSVNPGIIGGVVVKTNSSRIDASHKNSLIQIYQQMTKQA